VAHLGCTVASIRRACCGVVRHQLYVKSSSRHRSKFLKLAATAVYKDCSAEHLGIAAAAAQAAGGGRLYQAVPMPGVNMHGCVSCSSVCDQESNKNLLIPIFSAP
jgi:hypothetical protein